MIEQSENTAELFLALANAQATMPVAVKWSFNTFHKAKYADLTSVWDAARPTLADNGLSVVQEITGVDRGIGVTTQINHISGQWMRLGPLFIPADKVTAQGYGSAISYGKRYGLAAALGIVSEEDDDGNAASKKGKAERGDSEDWRQWLEPPANVKSLGKPHAWHIQAFKGLMDHCGARSTKPARTILKFIAPSDLLDLKAVLADPVFASVAWEKLVEKGNEIPFHKMLAAAEGFCESEEKG